MQRAQDQIESLTPTPQLWALDPDRGRLGRDSDQAVYEALDRIAAD